MGSTSQRTSNFIDHATSDVHKATMTKSKVECSKARGKSASRYVNHDWAFSVIDERRNARKDGDERRNARKDGEQVQCVLHDGKRELTVHQTPRIVGIRIPPWS